MERISISEVPQHSGETVLVQGWVHTRRDHGKLIFIDLRDRSGVLQVVFAPDNKELHAQADTLRSEWIVGITGLVKERPSGMQNKNIGTGTVELEAQTLEIYFPNKYAVQPMPQVQFAVDTDGKEINEESRLTYRYLDLRRERLQKNIAKRSEVTLFLRTWLAKRGFYEIETPILTKSTPEGARDYVVPSRLEQGTFYALPQSPQQYKQLLMVAGFERYFQIARCFRDEDTRGDRQPEFTQLDMEMSFVEQKDVMELNEALLIDLVQTLFPEKKIQEIPFPRIAYRDAMETYGTDRPDLRKDKNDPNLLAFCWVVDFPFFEKTDEGKWTFTHNPFSSPDDEGIELYMDGDAIPSDEDILKIKTKQYDIVLNGFEIGGGSIRAHQEQVLLKTFFIMGYEKERILNSFNHMLAALRFGAPPHGGIAWGLDRFVMLMQNEPNIREVIAFPKTGDGRDLMMHAPSEIEEKQLKELGLQIKKAK